MEKEINELLNMKYINIVNYLKVKYGEVPKNYFTSLGNKTQGIGRGKEGLFIHHIDEDKMILLSNQFNKHPVIQKKILNEKQVKLIKYDFQQKDRLVYCDLLEHLLLHLKIMEEPKPLHKKIKVGVGGVINFIVPELNDIFSGIKYKAEWKKSVINKVINRKQDFFKLLEYGINNLNISRNEYLTTFLFNDLIWKGENNFKLFQEFDCFLSKKTNSSE